MDGASIQMIAGTLSSIMFVVGTLPMLFKAAVTKDLRSYSLPNLLMSNVGNLVYWLYVVGLPVGPVWFLHGFNTVATLLMLVWYLLYRCHPVPCQAR